MHRPVPLLHVVGCEEVRDAGQLQQQPVLVAEHGCGSDDGGLREDVPRHLLAPALKPELERVVHKGYRAYGIYLGGIEFRSRIGVCVVRRDVDVPVDIILGDRLGDPFGALDMDVLQGEVPGPVSSWPIPPSQARPRADSLGGVVPADQVVDDVRVPDALLDRLGVVQIVFLASVQQLASLPGCPESLTMNTTRPRSPETLRWRFAISSRYGTMTVHPCLAAEHGWSVGGRNCLGGDVAWHLVG